MSFEVGGIYEGKVTGITKFGAFVDLGESKSGMVHISEVSGGFVKDINDVLTVGQQVTVKLIGINPDGKISLSIKACMNQDRPQRENCRYSGPKAQREPVKSQGRPGDFEWTAKRETGGSFEDLMSGFKKQSDEKMSDFKRANGDRRRSRKANR
ncbi:MAG: S1 RNA-binding domain-containing protein [Clostridia bacterium]|nr:S1 RNA-binding domain-containing protein [Clostridia bacterium]